MAASRVPASILRNGTVVVCCGSGVTLADLLRGLSPMPRHVVGVSSERSLDKIRQCVRKHLHENPGQPHTYPSEDALQQLPVDRLPLPDASQLRLKGVGVPRR